MEKAKPYMPEFCSRCGRANPMFVVQLPIASHAYPDALPSVNVVTTSVHFTSYDLRSEEDCAILPVKGTLSVVENVDPLTEEIPPKLHFECDGFRIYVGGTHLWLRECFATLDSERTLFMRHPYTGLLVEIAKVPQFDSPTDALVKMEELLHNLTAKPTPATLTPSSCVDRCTK